jgi:hypothetical protein
MAGVSGETAVDARALYAKISWRLIPYMFLLYIAAYLDRVNVGFAAMDMQRDLHFGVWNRRRDIFSWVCAVRSAEQFDSATGGNAGVDCADHDLVGCGFGLYGVGALADFVLSSETFAWSG